MAGPMSARYPTGLLLGGLLFSPAAFAVDDPTRPPAAWASPAEVSAGGNVDDGGFRLKSVLWPQHGKPLAIIGSQTVALGGRIGEARLIRLSEREAVLQGPEGVTRLYLTPDVEKQMIAIPGAHGKGKAGKGKDLP